VPTRKYSFPWGSVEKQKVSKFPSEVAGVIYYGGKAGDLGDWVIDNLPPKFTTFVDLFGGGGSITFKLVDRLLRYHRVIEHYEKTDDALSGKVIVYNDIGNVANLFRCLRDFGDELYTALYLTPFDRSEYMLCRDTWPSCLLKALESGRKEDYIEWARRWYVTVQVGFSHEEIGTGFKVSKSINAARQFAHRVDDLPYFIDNLHYVAIEKGDYKRVIDLYDSPTTLFYADPPYVSESRVRQDAYMNEMPADKQMAMLQHLKECKGQVVISGYHSDMYDKELEGWRVIERTAISGIANNRQQEDRGMRTEVLWLRERQHGLWTFEGT
jgi:DNA adenine methylase